MMQGVGLGLGTGSEATNVTGITRHVDLDSTPSLLEVSRTYVLVVLKNCGRHLTGSEDVVVDAAVRDTESILRGDSAGWRDG